MTIDKLIKLLQRLRRQAKKDVRVCMLTDEGEVYCLDFQPQVDIIQHAVKGGQESVLAVASHDIPLHDEDCGCAKLRLVPDPDPKGTA